MLEKVYTKAEEKRMKRNAFILKKAKDLYEAGSTPSAIYSTLANELKCSSVTVRRVCIEGVPGMFNR